MSKIFEALKREQGEVPEIAMDRLLEGQTADEQRPAAAPFVKPVPTPREKAAAVEVPSGVRTAPLHVMPTAPILPFDGSHSWAGEEYRLLRTKIIQHPKQPQMMVVTSAGPSDGKSVTAINVAGAMALKSEARVLLVDGDFRRSTVARQLGIEGTPGLTDILSGGCSLGEAVVRAQQIQNLYILPSGKTSTKPTELLDSSRLAEFCASCRAQFRYIVVDSSPVGLVADYDLIQAACDGVIMVIRPDHTNRQRCLEALSVIPKDKLIGVVMNCATDWILDPHRRSHRYYSPYFSEASHVTPPDKVESSAGR
jgi:capsular exopolysaccharide synthesis family protein